MLTLNIGLIVRKGLCFDKREFIIVDIDFMSNKPLNKKFINGNESQHIIV